MEKYYVAPNTVGTYMIMDRDKVFPLSGQRYGYSKLYEAQKVADDLNAGRETPESLYQLWNAGTRKR